MQSLRFSLAIALVLGAASHAQSADRPAYRWLYLQQNLQVTDNLSKVEAVLERAAKAGYNGVVLADYKLNILDRVPEHYFLNAKRFRTKCAELNLEIIPAVMPFGYSDGILAHDPNLAEGLPCKDVPFQVTKSEIEFAGGDSNLVSGDFEQHKQHRLLGWDSQDEAGLATFADESVKHGGQIALRIENPSGPSGNRRVNKLLKVRPWMQIHASAWIKATEFESASTVRMFAIGKDGRVLSHSNLGVQREQDWKQHHVVFNTLANDEVRFYIGVWDARGGRLWIDDVQVREEPFVNLVRRPGCPLVVKDAASQTVYEEGKDFAKLRDEKLGVTPWAGNFDVYHAPPKLQRLPGSRMPEGAQLQVSYYHALTIYDNQVPCSLTEPKVFEVVEDQVRRVEKLFNPRTYFFSHDEIRIANWSGPERQANKSAGEVLAGNVRRCVQIARKVNPKARLCIWSDMFDPHHNAVDDFYLVNGDLAKSWEGLPKDMLIINWNSGKAEKSLPFFTERGHSQVLAGFYDAAPEKIIPWQKVGQGLSRVEGVMYTTWQGNFDELERFAELAWGGKR